MVANILETKITYDIYGNGKPIICIHGWLENKRCFRYQSYKSFLKDYQVIALDLPGFGGSGEPKEYSFEEITEIINGLAEELKLESFEVLGQCMGTVFALDYAVRYPEKVEKVILVEPMLYFPWWFKVLLIPKVNKGIIKAFIDFKMVTGIMNKYRPIKGFRRDFNRMKCLQRVNIPAALSYVKILRRYSRRNHEDRIKEITASVLIVSGENTFRQVKKSVVTLKKLFNIDNISHIEKKDKNHFIFFP